MDVYICFCCSYPIIFRGGPAHHPYHLGTGWPCWDMQQRGECTARINIRFPSRTPKEKREKLLEEGKNLYEVYLRKRDPDPILNFTKRNLSVRNDVVRDLFAYLADFGDDNSNELIRKIIASPEWQRFFLRLRKKYK